MTWLYWAIAIGSGGAVLAVAWAFASALGRGWRARRRLLDASRVRALLADARDGDLAALEPRLFELRERCDPALFELELRDELRRDGAVRPPDGVVRAFAVLGLTERYLAQVREARQWEQRAAAAAMLGVLGDPRAVKPLVEALHDRREDHDVKLACAEALGQIRDPAAIPLLIAELEHVDEWSSPRLAAVLIAFGEAAVEPLLEALAGAPSMNVRIWSAQVLGKLGDPRVLPPLVARIHDRVDAMRVAIVNALGDLRDGRAARPLIDAILRDPSPTVRAQAAAALGRLGDTSSLPQLIAALGDLEHWVRLRALEAIEATAPSDTTPIERALDDANPQVRYRAALALERLGALDHAFAELASDDDARAAEAERRLLAVGRAGLSERLHRHVEDPSPRVRARIVHVLGALGELAHAAAVAARLADRAPEVRRAAIDALGAIGARGHGADPKAASRTAGPLLAIVRDGDPEERAAATAALLRHEPVALATVTADLLRLAGHERDEVRAASVQVLAVVPGDDIDAQLRVAAADRFAIVQLAAVEALGQRRVPAIAEIGECLESPLDALRIAAATALGAIGGPRAIELLLGAMPHARDAYRDAVCAALAGFGWEAAYPTFDVLLAADDLASRLGVVWTLGKTSDPRAVPILHMLLREPEPRVRSAAAGALAKIRDPRAVPILGEALGDPSPYVRSAVVNALGGHGAPAAMIAPVLADPDEFVRNRAALAVGRVGGAAADDALAAAAGLAPAVLAIARGLTGTEAGIAAAVCAMQDATLRRELDRVLAGEPAALRRRLFDNLQLGDPSDAAALEVGAIVERYVATLRNSSDVGARRAAARVIGRLADVHAVPSLTTALRNDPAPEVRQLAASALGGRGDPAARAALLAAVRDPDPQVRLSTIRALGRDLSPREAAPLFEVLASPQPELIDAAEAALAAIHTRADALAPVLDWMMAQEADALVCAGLRVLTRIGDVRAMRAIQALVRSPAAAVRAEAVRALAAIQVPAATRIILDGLDDPVAAVRVAVVASLRGLTRAEMVERLARAAGDPSTDVRLALCDTLATLETNQAVPLLAQLAGDHDGKVSARAVLGLLSTPDPEGLPRALAVWPTLPPPVRRNVKDDMAGAVARLEDTLARALEPDRRETAVRVLAIIDATAHAARIARALDDPDGRVRLAAVKALYELEPERVGDWLARVRDDPVAEVRAAARRGPWKVV